MADFSSLKQTIQTYVKQNGNEEITGNILQDVLLAMVTTMGDSAINSLASALQDEITARQNQDGTLQGNITAETTARQQADTALGGRIDGLQTAFNGLQTAINGINTKLAEGYIYAGIATPSTNPGTPSGKVFYIAVSSGTYTNFSNLTAAQGINILKYNGSAWSKDVVYAIDTRPKKNSQNIVTSGGVFDNIGALDVSELNATENPHTLAQYADLSAALAAIPSDYQKGGMGIKFVQSSDNNYVQFRYIGTSTAAADFTNTANWQGVDVQLTAGSRSTVESGGVENRFFNLIPTKETLNIGSVVGTKTYWDNITLKKGVTYTLKVTVSTAQNGSYFRLTGSSHLIIIRFGSTSSQNTKSDSYTPTEDITGAKIYSDWANATGVIVEFISEGQTEILLSDEQNLSDAQKKDVKNNLAISDNVNESVGSLNGWYDKFILNSYYSSSGELTLANGFVATPKIKIDGRSCEYSLVGSENYALYIISMYGDNGYIGNYALSGSPFYGKISTDYIRQNHPNTKYIAFSIWSGSTSPTVNKSDVVDWYIQIDYKSIVSTSKIENGAVTPEKLSQEAKYTSETKKAIENTVKELSGRFTKFEINKYYSNQNGAPITDNRAIGWAVTEKFEIETNVLYRFPINFDSYRIFEFNVWDEDSTFHHAYVSGDAETGYYVDPARNLDAFPNAKYAAITLWPGSVHAALTESDVANWYIQKQYINIVKSENISDSTVTTEKIADGAITQEKLADDVEVGVQDGAVTTAKLADEAVINSKIADETIGIEKLSSVVLAYLSEHLASSITNNPDNVTLSSSNGVISMKEIAAVTSRMGTVYEYANITIDDSSVQAYMEKWYDSIVEIKGVITISLNSNYTLSTSHNIILHFNGGSIVLADGSQKIVTSKNVYVIAAPYQIFFGGGISGCAFSGSNGKPLKAAVSYGEWFGAKSDGETYSSIGLNKALALVDATRLQLLTGTYIIENTVRGGYYVGSTFYEANMDIYGSGKTVIKRCEEWIDIPITSAIPDTNPITFTVDTSSADYAKLKVGMGVSIYARTGTIDNNSFEQKYRIITAINGNTITCDGGKPSGIAASSDGTNTNLTNNFNLIQVNSASLRNLTIEGGMEVVPYARTHWQHAVVVSCAGLKASIEDCVINNAVGDAIVCYGKDSLIRHNVTQHSGSNGLHLSGCYGATVTDNHFFDCNLNPLTGHNEGAITYSNNIGNIVIDRNIFDTCLAGIGSLSSADNCKSIITNNTFVNFRTHGIEGICSTSAYGIILRNWIFKGNRFLAKANDVASTWEENYQLTPIGTQTDATGYGICLLESSGGYWEDVIISDNIFDDCGVYIGNCTNAIVSNNQFLYKNTLSVAVPANAAKFVASIVNFIGNIIKVATSMTQLIDATNGKVCIAQTMYSDGKTLSNTGSNVVTNNNVAI